MGLARSAQKIGNIRQLGPMFRRRRLPLTDINLLTARIALAGIAETMRMQAPLLINLPLHVGEAALLGGAQHPKTRVLRPPLGLSQLLQRRLRRAARKGDPVQIALLADPGHLSSLTVPKDQDPVVALAWQPLPDPSEAPMAP